MKINFNTEDIDIDDLKNEFKEYIEKGLTVDQAITRFNSRHYFFDNLEVYHSLVGVINLRYARDIYIIADDIEIEAIEIARDESLRKLYKRKKECEESISNLMNELGDINAKINMENKRRANG